VACRQLNMKHRHECRVPTLALAKLSRSSREPAWTAEDEWGGAST
jgi:hypothetical protein